MMSITSWKTVIIVAIVVSLLIINNQIQDVKEEVKPTIPQQDLRLVFALGDRVETVRDKSVLKLEDAEYFVDNGYGVWQTDVSAPITIEYQHPVAGFEWDEIGIVRLRAGEKVTIESFTAVLKPSYPSIEEGFKAIEYWEKFFKDISYSQYKHQDDKRLEGKELEEYFNQNIARNTERYNNRYSLAHMSTWGDDNMRYTISLSKGERYGRFVYNVVLGGSIATETIKDLTGHIVVDSSDK